MAQKKTTFEQDMARIEELVQSMRDKNLSETVDTYVEAMKLIVKCKETLDSYRAKVEAVSADGTTKEIEE